MDTKKSLRISYHIPYLAGMGDDRFVYNGFKKAFTDLGHTVIPFTENENADLRGFLDRVNPDIFVTTMPNQTWDPAKAAPVLQEYRARGMKVFLHSGWLRPDLFPERYTEIIPLIRAGKLADKYYSDCPTPKKYFEDLTGVPSITFPLAGDKPDAPAKPMKRYECNLIFIGANLPMKQDIFRRRLHPLFKKYNVKVFGGDWDLGDKYFLHPAYKIERMLGLGHFFADWRLNRQVPEDEAASAYVSAKICLNFHEWHPGTPPCINGRVFRIPVAGGFEICDPVPHVRDYFTEDEMPAPESDEEFFRVVEYYLTHDAERQKAQEKVVAKARAHHTWHNRAQTMIDWYYEAHS